MHLRHARKISRHALHVSSTTLLVLVSIFLFTTTIDKFGTSLADGPNYTPTFNSIKLTSTQGGSALTSVALPESSFAQVYLEGSITDLNGCEDVASTTAGRIDTYLKRSSISSCTTDFDRDDRYCYLNTYSSGGCTTDCVPNTGMATTTFSCPYKLWWIADPTDTGIYAAQTWTAFTSIEDTTDLSATTSTSVEVLTTNAAVTVSSTLAYGNMPFFTTSTLDAHWMQISNTGNNNSLGLSLTGTDFACYSGSIGLYNIHVASTTGIAWEQKPFILSSTSTNSLGIVLPKASSTSTSSTITFYPQMYMSGGSGGTCSATISVIAQ